MKISLLSQLFFICTLSTFYITSFTDVVYSQCLDNQKTLLFEFKAELKFDSSYSRKLVHWNLNEDCCRWEGVECDGAGHVINLELDDEGISGRIENSSTLFSLKYLKKLNLAYNDFSRVQIPRRIHNLTHLTHFNLSNANFSGQVPIEISRMRTLVSLDLSSKFKDYGDLKLEKPNLRLLIQNLTGLRELYLDSVDISSQRTEWCEIISSSLPDLRKLSLCGCGISGPLDHSLSQLHSLSVLQLDHNNLSTTVPNFFANFSSLTTLSLIYCSLTGHFPEVIFQVPTLETLNLAYNWLLSGTITQFHHIGSFRTIVLACTNFSGSLPDSISNLTMLSHLFLYNCKFTGPIPQSLFRLPLLQRLYLSKNNFSGRINEVSTPLSSNMEVLDLRSNQLEGPIPKFFFKLERLTILSLSYNSFNGTVEVEKFQRLSNLRTLGLASCNLYKFPAFIKQSNVTDLDLSNNKITGEIPSWIWEVGNRQLRRKLPIPHDIGSFISSVLFLSLANNSLNGAILTSFCNATKLGVLDLSNNNLNGGIPPCLVKNISLRVLNLGRNNISGNIPNAFPVGCRLNTLDLRENNLRGNIPLSLANCKSLGVLNVGNNKINDSFPCMLSSNLCILVLRSNRFHGEVRCHDNWPFLQIIDIASNNFSGYLYPRTFLNWGGMMTDSVLNLSYNKLAGMIPKGRQLQTFPPTSFDGNIELCGFPLNRSCNNTERSGSLPKFKNEQWHKKNEIDWDYVSAALGFVVGLGSYLWLLWGCESLRRKIFDLIDNFLAKIFYPQDRRKRHGRRLVRNQVIRRG
ncbi:Leucine-rich repeat protein [Handroanthus impetiginosus]|uniref:Leucine-rich repeat protein n=1 Tax=Handroanthus impetiginosus TaxID=429701 RepID=A0A2G9HBI2_9LAMI|nr:Leucine-rich repeat protein [Handroanthus impetiginosus]